jgi:hypothetical protein
MGSGSARESATSTIGSTGGPGSVPPLRAASSDGASHSDRRRPAGCSELEPNEPTAPTAMGGYLSVSRPPPRMRQHLARGPPPRLPTAVCPPDRHVPSHAARFSGRPTSRAHDILVRRQRLFLPAIRLSLPGRSHRCSRRRPPPAGLTNPTPASGSGGGSSRCQTLSHAAGRAAALPAVVLVGHSDPDDRRHRGALRVAGRMGQRPQHARRPRPAPVLPVLVGTSPMAAQSLRPPGLATNSQ